MWCFGRARRPTKSVWVGDGVSRGSRIDCHRVCSDDSVRDCGLGVLDWRVGRWLISRPSARRAPIRRSACGGLAGGRSGPRSGRRLPGGARCSSRGDWGSAGVGASAAVWRWCARRRSAWRAAVVAFPAGRAARRAARCPSAFSAGADLVGGLVGRAPVALVGLGCRPGPEPELLGDALGARRSLVVHALWGPRPTTTADAVVVSMVFCCVLPETKDRHSGRLA